MKRDADHDRFWNIADDFIATGQVEEGTMMGHHCLRATVGNGLVATVERSSGNLVVKLPRDRVTDLVGSGGGVAFAPAGKVFKEWVAIPAYDPDRWSELITESISFVGRAS
ncbi:MAG: hypothetical protein BMS9Abin07_1425 [Acidimicrobiia bacterium]|nr:MAG: hypothetical protein BMS9Abin07_1425 [Acidimicrobiia bacterium]